MEITPKAATKSVYSTPENTAAAGDTGSPCGSGEGNPHKLSASLRERLKRARRSFTSPSSVAKRLCVDEEDETRDQRVTTSPQETVTRPPVIRHHADVSADQLASSDGGGSGPVSEPCLDKLRREVKDKTETLRRLKMVKMYRSKNNLAQLQSLIDKWRSCAQAALYELQSQVTPDGKKASLSQLIDLFGLEDNILHFDRTEEDFTT